MFPGDLGAVGSTLSYTAGVIMFPNIDPVAVQLGPVAIHWYGLSYLAGIALGWWYLSWRARFARGDWNGDAVSDVVFYAALGAVAGGRIGYVLFYSFDSYLTDPMQIFAVWRGGMSFHGGVVGTILALWIYARRTGRRFLVVSDFVVPAVPIGLTLGRVANFINQELWGAPSDLPWAVLFTHPAAGGVARHPSQLYEAGLEGLGLFVILFWVARHSPPVGRLTGLFLLGYSFFRIAVEFVREPDNHIGYLYADWLTMGQVLSLPMAIVGLSLVALSARDRGA